MMHTLTSPAGPTRWYFRLGAGALLGAWNRHKPILVGLIFILGLMAGLFSWNRSEFFGPDAVYYFGRFLHGWPDLIRAFVAIDDRGHYRPMGLVMFTYLFFPLFGYNPPGHHLVPLVFHAVNTVLAYLIARRLLPSPVAALAVAFVFALHRVNFFVTYGITFIPDFTGAFFLLSAFFAYLKSERNDRWIAIAYVSWIASVLSKESAVFLPAILTSYEVMRSNEERVSRRLWASAKQTAIFWGLALLFIGAIWFMRGGALYPDSAAHPYRASLSLESAVMKVKYLWWGLNLPQGTGMASFFVSGVPGLSVPIKPAYPRLTTAAALLMFPVIIVFLAFVGRAIRRLHRASLLGLIWFLLALAPVLPLAGKVMQHNLYIPLLGVALLAGVFVSEVVRTKFKYVLAPAMAIFVFSTFTGVLNNRVNSWPVTSSRTSARLLKEFHAAIPGGFDCGTALLVGVPENSDLIWYTDSGNLFRVFGPCRDLKVYFHSSGVRPEFERVVQIQLSP
ncbi:MAG TPA: glycosyltransferase family 39 protein [Acidobacteriota bacterium]|jgi:4-amino-4-deoxy-L-arabinose transferase-like glycosyltransferase